MKAYGKVNEMSFPPGKVYPEILKRTVFRHLGLKSRDVVVGPSEGEDAAIIRVGDKLLAIHCDPISGAYSNIGLIAMNIATNDIATRGVRPRWTLSCIMLPRGSDENVLNDICAQMGDAAERLGVSIVGGHSEVTPGLSHPLVMVTAFGVAEGGRYVTSSGAKPGSKIILSKSVGIEGTAILAADRGKLLFDKFGEEFVEEARAYFGRLSVLKEALAAFTYGGVLAMHDPTEGGVAGGLNEVADASKVGFRVYEDKIAIGRETSEICRFFEIDPLKLISSGALLIVASPEKADGIVKRLEKENVKAVIIGETLSDITHRTIVRRSDVEETLPMPLSDELWRALERKL